MKTRTMEQTTEQTMDERTGKTMEEAGEAGLRRPPRRPGGEPAASAAWISPEELVMDLKPERVQQWLELWP
jgi:hypothetical protein